MGSVVDRVWHSEGSLQNHCLPLIKKWLSIWAFWVDWLRWRCTSSENTIILKTDWASISSAEIYGFPGPLQLHSFGLIDVNLIVLRSIFMIPKWIYCFKRSTGFACPRYLHNKLMVHSQNPKTTEKLWQALSCCGSQLCALVKIWHNAKSALFIQYCRPPIFYSQQRGNPPGCRGSFRPLPLFLCVSSTTDIKCAQCLAHSRPECTARATLRLLTQTHWL